MRSLRLIEAAIVCSASLTHARSTQDAVTTCCAGLLQALLGKVYDSRDQAEAYKSANEARWTARQFRSPTCIVQPADTKDVSTIMKVLTTAPPKGLPACPFAIKSGGHTAHEANNIDGGVSVDLSNIKDVAISSDRKVVSVGPGNTWIGVAEALHKSGTGIQIPGGRCAMTGVGGVALGGGISFFAPSVGFVADNVVNYEIVLADGTISNANKTFNPDLWMALKGGSSNFGIVTRFDILSLPVPNMWGTAIPVPVSEQTTPMVLSAMHAFTAYQSWLPTSSFGSLFHYNATHPSGVSWNQLLHFGSSLRPLKTALWMLSTATGQPALPLTDYMQETNLPEWLALNEPFWPRGHRNIITTVAFVNDVATIAKVQEITESLYEDVKHIQDIQYMYAYEPLPHHFSKLSKARGGNMLGLSRTKDDLILMQLIPVWTQASDDDLIDKVSKRWVKEVREYTESVGKGSGFLYLNYADGWQEPIESYGEESVRFLRGVSERYDPDGVFQKSVPGGFKLPKPRDVDNVVRDEL